MSIGCDPSQIFHGRIACNTLDFNFGIRPLQQPIPTLQISQDVLDHTEMIHQDVRKNAMNAYIKYKVYYDEKTNASKLREAEFCIRLTTESGSSRVKIPFIKFWWIGPYIFENLLPNNNYLVRKIGTNKMQVLCCMRLRQFTPRQPLLDVQVTPQKWKPDPQT